MRAPGETPALASFLPQAVVRVLTSPTLETPYAEVCPGAVLLADISGFTSLAEELARQGPRGAEELTRVLNGVLGAMVARIEHDGGQVAKFAGDALLATWSGDAAAAAWRATACGQALHVVAAEAAADAGVPLTLSVGVAVGTFRLLVLQGTAQRWEHLPIGPPLSHVAVASRHAGAGETVVSPDTWTALGGRAGGEPRSDGCVVLVGAVRPPPPQAPLPSGPLPPEVRLLPFVPPAVRDRLGEAGAEWLSELRRVSVVFVHLDPGVAAPPSRVQDIFAHICRVVEDLDGVFDKLTVDDKGLSAVVGLGLPPRAHADDPLRAVRVAMRLHEDLRGIGVTASLGVASGRVFCGAVGSATRREYTVIGDAVNLAARLMQHAGDGVLVDEGTVQACHDAVTFEAPRRLRLKGKAEEIAAFVPVAAAVRGERTDPVHGAEQARLRTALDALVGGRGGLLWIEAAPGLGKSTLLSHLVAETCARGVRAASGAADVQDRGAPYRAWQPVLTTLLGLETVPDVGSRVAKLEERLGDDPWAWARAPLLAEPLGLAVGDNALTVGMVGEVRAFNTQDLVVHLLCAATEAQPLVITLDDVQWLDSASFALLREVARQVPRVLLVVAGRPFEGPIPGPGMDLQRSLTCERIVLSPLDDAGTGGLLRGVLGAEPDPELRGRVHERAEGNPFFTVELMRGLLADGAVSIEGGVATLRTRELRLPETVEGAILARIDRLDAVGQLLAKVASVIGRSFAWGLVVAVHPVAAHRPVLRTCCDDLVRADLTLAEASEPEEIWRYRHETTREVAYELLLYAQRRQLHESVASALEQQAAALGVAAPYARLAWHWDLAERPDRALPFLEAAGDQALREGAYEEALDAFTRALALFGSDASADRRAHAELQRGEALLGLGRLGESRAALERAVVLLGFSVPDGSLSLGFELATGAVGQLRRRVFGQTVGALDADAVERHRKAARACLRIIETCFFLAGPVETTHAALRALQVAEAAGPSPELARAYALFGWILSMVPLFSVADHYLALAEDLVARPDCAEGLQPVRFFTGFTRTATGRWEDARLALTDAIELARARGDKRRWIEAVCGICSPMHYQGEYEARIELGKGVLYASARRQGDRQAEAWGILDQLESLLPLRDLDRIGPLLDELVPYLDRPIGRSEHVWANGLLALGRHWQGRREEAFCAAVRANDAAAGMDPVAVYVYEGHAAACEALLALVAEGWSGQPGTRLRAELARALHQLARYTRVFPYAKARLLSCRGRALGLHRSWRAPGVLRRAVATAVAVRMPLEEAIARRALARLTGEGEEASRADAIFAALGAQGW